jgi:AcrR family transcriptional regulator
MSAADAERRPGRPRDPELDGAILAATIEVLCEQGFAGTSVEAVAERAGVGKATIYRRWPTREDLLLAAGACMGGCGPVPDTGSLRRDLMAVVANLASMLRTTPVGALLPAVVDEAARNPDLRSRFDAFIADRRAPVREILARAEARGEIRTGVDHEVVVDLLSGPVFTRVLVTGRPLDGELARRIVDIVLDGVATGRPAGK